MPAAVTSGTDPIYPQRQPPRPVGGPSAQPFVEDSPHLDSTRRSLNGPGFEGSLGLARAHRNPPLPIVVLKFENHGNLPLRFIRSDTRTVFSKTAQGCASRALRSSSPVG